MICEVNVPAAAFLAAALAMVASICFDEFDWFDV
jgi:hypothetical protein